MQARLDELREAAANAAAEREEEEGEEEKEEPEVTLGDEPMVDVEAEVAAAVEKVGGGVSVRVGGSAFAHVSRWVRTVNVYW